MDSKPFWSRVALMVFSIALAIVMYAENVRTVQVLGLFVCGALFGISLYPIISALRAKKGEQ